MWDDLSYVYSQLSNDATLIGLVGTKDHITEIRPEIIETFPMVVYTSDQYDKEYLDNKPKASDSTITIDVFVKNDTTTAIGQQVATIFNNLYWNCAGNTESYDPDPMVRHRIMRFNKANLSDDLNYAKSSAKAITAFSIPSYTGVIDATAHTITIDIPFGYDVSALQATWTTTGNSVKIGAVTQIPGMTVNDFTATVTYIVVAEDATTQDYTVTLAPQGTYLNMLTDSTGAPIIVYKNLSNVVQVCKKVSGVWTLVTTDITTTGKLVACIDSADSIYIAYIDSNNSNKISVRQYTTEWAYVGSAGFSAADITDLSITTDSSNYVYVSYISGDALYVFKYTTAWSEIGDVSAIVTGTELVSSGIQVDSLFNIYVGIKEHIDDYNQSPVAKYSSGTWAWLGSEVFDIYLTGSQILLDSNNIYVAGRDESAGGYKATVRTYNTTTLAWDLVGLQGFSPTQANGIQMRFTTTGIIYLAYTKTTVATNTALMKYATGAWSLVNSYGTGVTSYNALTISGTTLYLAYVDNIDNKIVINEISI
ncbi:MAG: hypothetical protein PHX80_04245 [Candidatus Nanoarchaeia archaeon]|nr:hypothetical protein [Candidatus Nanoarchaeia archaeon]